jgi:hypothetical protein
LLGILIYIGVLNCTYLPNLIGRQLLFATIKTSIGYQRYIIGDTDLQSLIVLNLASSLLAESIFYVQYKAQIKLYLMTKVTIYQQD